jgi:hypothetical protein
MSGPFPLKNSINNPLRITLMAGMISSIKSYARRGFGQTKTYGYKYPTKTIAEPPKLCGPHTPVIVPKTSNGYACTPDNLRRSVGCPRRTPIQLRLTTHTRINKGVTTTLQHLYKTYIRVRKNNNNEFINHD